ncbi:DUF2920 family protein, partial [Campylobacter lari]
MKCYFIYKKSYFKNGGGIKTILIGASHGGYLANLCAKIAPWNVDNIVDNSSLVNLKKLWKAIGYGKEVDYTKYESCATFEFFHNIRLC